MTTPVPPDGEMVTFVPATIWVTPDADGWQPVLDAALAAVQMREAAAPASLNMPCPDKFGPTTIVVEEPGTSAVELYVSETCEAPVELIDSGTPA